ncbi:MAG: hypothetical protein LBO81_06095 [Clostridiales Family XIII bacterium]|jgi:hypothetical protein|nr:hypothetical protein [Clostridiales Family XIII bacterium]
MFDVKRSRSGKAAEAAWRQELEDLETRWFAFLEKMEAKMEELCSAALPELRALRRDPDSEQVYLRMLAGVEGQLGHIRDKVYETRDAKVIDTWYRFREEIAFADAFYGTGNAFRDNCEDRYHAFEETYLDWHNLVRATLRENLEEEYRQILETLDANRGVFRCRQCGAPISVPADCFISVHLACPACATQNTFDPGSKARKLPFIARDLAEKRVSPLYGAYQQGGRTDALYRTYLRALYDELNRMLPALREHHETLYHKYIAAHTQGGQHHG